MKNVCRTVFGMLALWIAAALPASAQHKWFTTYYSTWSMMPLGTSELALPPWEIDWTGLTHVVLFDNGNVTQTPPYWAYMFGAPPRRPSDTESDSVCVEFNGVAFPGNGIVHYMDSLIAIAHRKGVKVVITIQAVNPLNLNYVAADSARTELFVNTVASWAERKKFDGVELDWEGWAAPLPPASVVNRFVRILHRRIHAMQTVSGAPGLIMISAGSGQQTLYDPAQDYMVDQFNLQLYDYSYAWYAKIGSNASWYLSPLHRGTVDPTFEGQAYDTRGPLQWVAAGHEARRIGLGIPIFGNILRNVDGLFQRMGPDGDYGNAHYQTIEQLKEIGGVEEWDDVRKVRSIHGTAARSNGRSVYYKSDGVNAGQKFFATGENGLSLQEKIAWMNQNNLGGIMTYEFVSDLDWTQSVASGMRHPLHRVIANALGSSNPPVVKPTGSFTVSPPTLPPGGGTVTLSWNSSDAVQASIDQGVGAVPLNGSKTVAVSATTTFTLTLSGAGGTTQLYAVTPKIVQPLPAGSFSVIPSSLPPGGGTVKLTWTSLNAVIASIDGGVGAVALTGTREVHVASSRSFTLSLINADGALQKYSAFVSVAIAPPAGSLKAAPASLPAGGGKVTLIWTSANAASAAIDQGIGEVGLNGSKEVDVNASKTFTLTLTNSEGVTERYSASVSVRQPSPTGTFSIVPSKLPVGGGFVKFVWTSENAASAAFDHGVGAAVLNGTASVRVLASTVFTLTLSNSEGESSMLSASVTVDTVSTQTIQLAGGWNLISSYVRPDQLQIPSIFWALGGANCVVKNGEGGIFWPQYSINTISSWDPKQGYLVYTDKALPLTITGTFADPSENPIELRSGLNLIAYLRTTPLPPASAFSSLKDSLLIVADGEGKMYWPARNVFTLTSIVPGSGYIVYVSAPARLSYPNNAVPAGSAGIRRLELEDERK